MKATYIAFILAIVAVAVGALWYTHERNAIGKAGVVPKDGSYVFTCDRGVEFVLTPSDDLSRVTITPTPGTSALREAVLYESAAETGRRYRSEDLELQGLGHDVSIYITSSGITHACRQQPKSSSAPLDFGKEPVTSGQVPQRGTQTPAAGTSVTVQTRLGQSVEALGEIITPKTVLEDSRCPSDVQCIWAGTVRVEGVVQGGMGEGSLTFELDKMNTTEVNEITLVGVEPYPMSTDEIRGEEYVLTFVVTRR